MADDDDDASMQEAKKNVFGVLVHHSDCLNLDSNINHPSVKVVLLNLSNGESVKKQRGRDKDKVTCFYEADHVKHILPLMTQPFPFKSSRTLVPRWEELLIYNVQFEYLAEELKENLGVFFLVQDFVSMVKVNNSKGRGSRLGWHDIAWAFLKPFPAPGLNNLERKLRLQLFKPQPRQGDDAASLWAWYSKYKRVKYSSSLYATIQAVPPPCIGASRESLRQEDVSSPGQPDIGSSSAAPNVPIWTRLPGEQCKIPNTLVARLNTSAACLQFSRDGRYLACGSAAQGDTVYRHVYVYQVSNWQLVHCFKGHSGPIYELDWDEKGALLSASGDRTARLWTFGPGRGSSSATSRVLEHPTFVYCARFHPGSGQQRLIVTGSYDKVIRIWEGSSDDDDDDEAFTVIQELFSHDHFVTSLEFDADGQNLFSGDKTGVVKTWEILGVGPKQHPTLLRLKRTLDLPEVRGHAVERLCVHPGGRRLLLQTSSTASSLLMVDLKQHTVMQVYPLNSVTSQRVGCCITPCGGHVYAGNKDDGIVSVWNADTGAERRTFGREELSEAEDFVRALCFHPLDHMLAVGLGGRKSPATLIFQYSSKNKL